MDIQRMARKQHTIPNWWNILCAYRHGQLSGLNIMSNLKQHTMSQIYDKTLLWKK